VSNATELPSRQVQDAQTSDLFKARRTEEYTELKQHFRQLRTQKPPVTMADTKTKTKRPFSFAGVLLGNDKFMQNLRASIEIASIPAPKIDYSNPRSLAASIADNPHLVDAFDPDFENMLDSQLSFGESLLNRSRIVWDIVNGEQQNAGLIQWGDQ
jgi:hypothetical protein